MSIDRKTPTRDQIARDHENIGRLKEICKQLNPLKEQVNELEKKKWFLISTIRTTFFCQNCLENNRITQLTFGLNCDECTKN